MATGPAVSLACSYRTRTVTVPTPVGPAQVELHGVTARSRGLLLLGHGAGGGFGAVDLVTTREAALAVDVAVGQFTQPYRLAGRGVARPQHLDQAALAVLDWIAGRSDLAGLDLVLGGRSSGARVAARTAPRLAAVDNPPRGVIALAFPVLPAGQPPAKSRIGELDAVPVPVLVIQGDRDPYGRPPRRRGRTLLVVRGTHTLRADRPAMTRAVTRFLRRVLPG